MPALQPGTPAPDFTLNTHLGEPVTLSAYRGKKVLLAFHPASFTGGWLNQVTGFRANLEGFKKAGVEIIEVSVDSAAVQKAWSESMGGIPFPIASDFHPKAAVAMAYGVYNEERGNARRSTFLIDEQGVIRWSFEYPQGVQPNSLDILEQVKKM